ISALVPGLKSNQDAAGNIMVLAMSCAGLVGAARMLLPLPAIVLHESGPALRRAWALSTGNFLPLLGIFLAVFLPAKLFQISIELWFSGKAALSAGATQQMQLMQTLLNARQMLPLACGLSFFISP